MTMSIKTTATAPLRCTRFEGIPVYAEVVVFVPPSNLLVVLSFKETNIVFDL